MNKGDLIPVITQEECAEVIQAISKVFRFGLYQTHPETNITNKLQLETELGQLKEMIKLLCETWGLDEHIIHQAMLQKSATMHKWFEYFPKD